MNQPIVIYNPHAGKKSINPIHKQISLEDIKSLFSQYQIPAKFIPTKYPNHATKIAKDYIKKGCKLIIVAGGDGTVGEVATSLVNKDVTLAILPLGSYMNIARMLCIPKDLEKTVQLIKINRTRKIDVGGISILSGKAVKPYHYFFEEAGTGIEGAYHHRMVSFLKNKNLESLTKLLKLIYKSHVTEFKVILDEKEITTTAKMISISNGPFTWAALNIAPDSKLNDHHFTITLYYMSKLELFIYFIALMFEKNVLTDKIQRYQSKEIKISSKNRKFIHADTKIFGETPATFKILPNALKVITGFPEEEKNFLEKRTELDP